MSGSSANNTDNISRITAHYINDRSELSVDTIHIIVPIAAPPSRTTDNSCSNKSVVVAGWCWMERLGGVFLERQKIRALDS